MIEVQTADRKSCCCRQRQDRISPQSLGSRGLHGYDGNDKANQGPSFIRYACRCFRGVSEEGRLSNANLWYSNLLRDLCLSLFSVAKPQQGQYKITSHWQVFA